MNFTPTGPSDLLTRILQEDNDTNDFNKSSLKAILQRHASRSNLKQCFDARQADQRADACLYPW